WHEAEESRVSRLTPPAHPLLGVARGGPQPAWEARPDLRPAPYLADHRVQQAAPPPATACLDLPPAPAPQARTAAGPPRPHVPLANPCCVAPDQPLRLRTAFDPDAGTVRVHTRPVHDGRDWTIHLTASVHDRPAGADESAIDLDQLRLCCPREFSGERCYEYL